MGIVRTQKRTKKTTQSSSSGKMTVLVKQKYVETFLGTDLNLYGPYKKGDLISLPTKYGKIFVERGIAVKSNKKLPVKKQKAREPAMILASIIPRDRSISNSELMRRSKKEGLSIKQVNETLVSLKNRGYVIESGKDRYEWV